LTHRARKRFGQNFLHDQGVIQRIVQAVGPRPGQHLVEIGPGQGAITRGLLEAAGRLDVVELDRDLIPQLEQQFAGQDELCIHSADALKFDVCQLLPGEGRLRVIGNLPYNISTPILFHLLDQADCIEDMHFMLQKEVVERMAADPGSRTYGRLSVMLQARCQVESLFWIGPGAFRPAPKVDSAFVHLTPFREAPFQLLDPGWFRQIVTHAFSQRRKTLRNSLRGLTSAAQLEAAGIDPGLRAERLSVGDFVRLANSTCNSPAAT